MSTEFHDTNLSQIRDLIARLENPIPDISTLQALLAAPLGCIKLLPPQYIARNISPLPSNSLNVSKHIPAFQRALLEYIIPSWEPSLVEADSYNLVEQYFSPDAFSFASPLAAEVAVQAYSTILSLPITKYSIHFLVRLSKAYPVDVLWSSYFSKLGSSRKNRHSISWEDCIRNIAAVPSKAANSLGPTAEIPPELMHGSYFNNVSLRTEILISSMRTDHSREDVVAITYLMTKLVNIGIFPPTKQTLPAQPSFFQPTLTMIRKRIRDESSYEAAWAEVIDGLASTLALQAIMSSLFAHLTLTGDFDSTPHSRASVTREASLIRGLLGKPSKDKRELWDGVSATVIGRDWDICYARIFVCWVAGAKKGNIDVKALESFLKTVVNMWTSPDHIRHSLLGKQRYLTALFLLSLSYLSSEGNSTMVTSLALSPAFIKSISTYISHLDPSVRRCGMLVAEELAARAGKKLDFGEWDGDSEGKDWCRSIRRLIQERDIDAESEVEVDSDNEIPFQPQSATDPSVNKIDIPSAAGGTKSAKLASRKPMVQELYDSDDSLTGYASSPNSSRSASPTPSELEEIEKDPTLRVGHTKVARPVYLAQLGEMVRPTSGLKSEVEDGEVKRIEVALDTAEELIRRKRSYGTELDENAVNLVYGFVGLQDNFDLEDFNKKRQAALNALVACCPRKSAPALIEEFFKNQYSTDQRYAILNALALGARELASLPIPLTSALQPTSASRLDFPSKQLPAQFHNRYITSGGQPDTRTPVQNLLEDISKEAIDKEKEVTADKVPELVRERQLRIRSSAKITEISPSGRSKLPSQMTPVAETKFTDVAAEYLICPLINRFWLYLRDEQTRESRTADQSLLHQYRGSGTGLILNALVLPHLLATLAVMVHAARNAKEWLAVIAPDALELAVTLGTRRLSISEGEDEDRDKVEENAEIGTTPGAEPQEKGRGKEAAVITTSLELALMVLDGSVDLDGGRSLSLEHTALVMGIGEWASTVLTTLEKGTRVLGGGGRQEVKLKRAAAGVILKIEEVTSRWRRSMITASY